MNLGKSFVLIGTSEAGKPVEVGLFDNEAEMRFYVARNTRVGCRFSVWTPSMNDTIKVPAVVGISFEK